MPGSNGEEDDRDAAAWKVDDRLQRSPSPATPTTTSIPPPSSPPSAPWIYPLTLSNGHSLCWDPEFTAEHQNYFQAAQRNQLQVLKNQSCLLRLANPGYGFYDMGEITIKS